MDVRFLMTRIVPSVTVGATLACGGTAQGFFPPIPTGSGEVVTPPVISPIVPVVPVPVAPVTPVTPPTPVVPPPPVVVDPCPCQPCDVPEPATILSGLVGLSVAGAAALKKKWSKK